MKYIIVLITILISINLNAQDKWYKLNGPVGGFIIGLNAFGDTLITGIGDKGIIFYSTNAGNSWEQANFKISERIVDFVKSSDGAILTTASTEGIFKSYNMDKWSNLYNNGNFFLYLGKDYHGNLFVGTDNGKIYSSSNNGDTWSISSDYSEGTISNFILSEDSTIYAGGWEEILKKEPGSTTWEIIPLDTVPSRLYRVFLDNIGYIYAFNSGTRIIMSSDQGNSWQYLDPEGFLRYGNQMYAGIYNNRIIGGLGETGLNSGYGIAVSDDGGYNWYWSNNGLPPKFSAALRLTKFGSNTYLGTNAAGVFKSTNYGESWFPVNNGITAANTLDLIISSDSTLYTANWSNGIQKSTDDGVTWEVINNGLTNVYLYSIVEDDTGVLLAGTDQGIFRSTDQGENWIETSAAGNNYCYHLYKDNQNRIYALTYGSGVYRTTDLGNSWTRIDQGFVSSYTFGFALDRSGALYAGTRQGAIYKSTDDGNSWQLKYLSSNSSTAISSISISPNGYVFAANTREGILRSTDEGESWEIVEQETGSFPRYPIGINNKGEIYGIKSNNIIIYSTDNGDNWKDITNNTYLLGIKKFVFDEENNVYLATDESVWKGDYVVPVELLSFTAILENKKVKLKWQTASEINNQGFEIERTPLSPPFIKGGKQGGFREQWRKIGFVEGSGTTTEPQSYLFIDENVTSGKYQYRLKQIDFDGSFENSKIVEVEVNQPLKFSLEQNYPNPFNPSTKINYSIPEDAIVSVKIYNSLGQQVAELYNGIRNPGNYTVNFDASNLPAGRQGLASGIYIYRISAIQNNKIVFQDSKRMVLLK